jgi:hypothetical protein
MRAPTCDRPVCLQEKRDWPAVRVALAWVLLFGGPMLASAVGTLDAPAMVALRWFYR